MFSLISGGELFRLLDMRISFGMLMEIRNLVWGQRKWGFQEEKLEHNYFKRIGGVTEQHG